jgi:hypothetical protein
LTAADLDGDRDKDVVAVGGMNSLIVLRYDGHGNFERELGSLPVTAPSSLVAADFDGDGRIDVAIPSFQSSEVVLLPNREGTFSGE